MRNPAVVFKQTGFTVHAGRAGEAGEKHAEWRGEILDERGQLHDGFSYVREGFPGAVIGALRVGDIAFATKLAARMWLHTSETE
jgi:hypothetical protein